MIVKLTCLTNAGEIRKTYCVNKLESIRAALATVSGELGPSIHKTSEKIVILFFSEYISINIPTALGFIYAEKVSEANP